MKLITKTVVAFLIAMSLSVVASAASKPAVYRNGSFFDIAGTGGALAVLVVSTYPIQAHQAVYATRNHTLKNGNAGALGLDKDIIGYTDALGVLSIIVRLPNDSVYCGKFSNEVFSVGNPNGPTSTPLNYNIFRSSDFGPKDPNCFIY